MDGIAESARSKQKRSSPTESAIEIIRETRTMVWEWTKERGPVSDWSAAFLTAMQDAGNSRKRQDKAIQDWDAHAKVGKALMRGLQGVACSRLPTDEPLLRDTIRETIDLMLTLLTGVAMIEATTEAYLALLDQ
jgi:hypothetical protein